MKDSERPHEKGNLLAYLAATWIMFLIIAACCLIHIYVAVGWQLDEIGTGTAIVWGDAALIISNVAVIGGASYYRIHFGMTDEEIEEYVKKIRESDEKENDWQAWMMMCGRCVEVWKNPKGGAMSACHLQAAWQ